MIKVIIELCENQRINKVCIQHLEVYGLEYITTSGDMSSTCSRIIEKIESDNCNHFLVINALHILKRIGIEKFVKILSGGAQIGSLAKTIVKNVVCPSSFCIIGNKKNIIKVFKNIKPINERNLLYMIGCSIAANKIRYESFFGIMRFPMPTSPLKTKQNLSPFSLPLFGRSELLKIKNEAEIEKALRLTGWKNYIKV